MIRTPRTFINPVFSQFSEEHSVYSEGCLSVPEMYADVTRPENIELVARIKRERSRIFSAMFQRTAEVLAECAARIPNLRVVTHRVNQGYGAALKTGFTHARTEVVVITDADGTYPEDKIRDLLDQIDDGAEMAVGSRTGADVNIPLVRKPAKWFLKQLASFLAGTDIPDLNSGLRAFRRELVLKYRAILPQGFSFTTTITLASLTNGHRVEYVPVNYAKRSGSSKIRPIRDTLGFTALIIRTVLYFNPLKVFYPIAFALFLCLCGFLYYDVFIEQNLGDKTVFIFVAFLQVLTVGLLADLIEKKSRL